jgi:hypothetical protein
MVTEDHKISLTAGTKLPQTPRFNPLWKWYERAFLICHEGNEWRHDNRRPIEDHCWNLVDQRLSKAGRKRDERVVSIEDGDHRRFLLRPEPLDAERAARRPSAHIEQAHDVASKS